jgi:hypothetical protein
LAVLPELEGRFHQGADRVCKKSGSGIKALKLLPIPPCELGFIIPCIQVRGTSVDEEPDHMLGLPLKMRLSRFKGIFSKWDCGMPLLVK